MDPYSAPPRPPRILLPVFYTPLYLFHKPLSSKLCTCDSSEELPKATGLTLSIGAHSPKWLGMYVLQPLHTWAALNLQLTCVGGCLLGPLPLVWTPLRTLHIPESHRLRDPAATTLPGGLPEISPQFVLLLHSLISFSGKLFLDKSLTLKSSSLGT